MTGEAHVFLAMSLDGFIAGPDDDLSWLPGAAEAQSGEDPDFGSSPGDSGETIDHGFDAFMATVGAMLMGRRTYEVLKGFGGKWPYGDTPLLVATTRPLGEPAAPTVSAVSGTPREMLAKARELAGEKVVYVDGGALIRSLLDEGLIDEMTITVIPVILGDGIPLFAGVRDRHRLRLIGTRTDGLLQLLYRPVAD
jgi:dihydrofolate reductase